MQEAHGERPDPRDIFTRDEMLSAWRMLGEGTISDSMIVEAVDQFFADRNWMITGDLIGLLAIQSSSALQRARLVWGDDATSSAKSVLIRLRGSR